MPFVLEAPARWQPERTWIYEHVLRERLGLAVRLAFREGPGVRLRHQDGRALHLADTLFETSEERWLTLETLPRRPLERWRPEDVGLTPRLASPELPILYGRGAARPRDDGLALDVDVFGGIFFLLSRYEEAVEATRDEHGRFPARASVAYREGFLERPLADEYVELLWACLIRLWPSLERRVHVPDLIVGHDVDRPRWAADVGALSLAKASVTSMAAGRLPRGAATLSRLLAVRAGLLPDPFDTYEALMDVSERAGTRARFFFYAGQGEHPRDPRYSLEDPWIRRLFARITGRGHGIGLHVGYGSHESPRAIARERERLERAARPWLGPAPLDWSRTHYLQLAVPGTLAALAEAELRHDCSLGFADHAGFRAGTCSSFPAFDLRARRVLPLREHPLIVMDCTLVHGPYMGLGVDEAEERVRRYRALCRAFGGAFTLLWHNHVLAERAQRHLYERAVLGDG